jgi:hypothetical protein
MTAQATAARGRAAAERIMLDTCTIRAEVAGASRTFNSSTGDYDPAQGDVIYSGKCRVKDATFRALEVEAGDAPQIVTQLVVSIPIAVTGILERQTLTVDTSIDDPALAGQVVRIVNVPHGSFMTARRLVCKEWT